MIIYIQNDEIDFKINMRKKQQIIRRELISKLRSKVKIHKKYINK